jgi:hypothetical protein
MSDELQAAEAKLRQLGSRVRAGLARLHPPTPQQLAKIRAAVRQQWEATQRAQAQTESSQTASPTQKKAQRQTRQPGKSKSRDRSQDHGHSH